MPLQEIDLNIVTIPRLSPLFQSWPLLKRKRGESSPGKSKGSQNIFDVLRSAVVILRELNKNDFKAIYEKTEVKKSVASNIVQQVKEAIQSDDFLA